MTKATTCTKLTDIHMTNCCRTIQLLLTKKLTPIQQEKINIVANAITRLKLENRIETLSEK